MIRIAYYQTSDTYEPGEEEDGILTTDLAVVDPAERAAMTEDGADPALVALVRFVACDPEDRDDAIIEADVPAALVPWLESHRSVLD